MAESHTSIKMLLFSLCPKLLRLMLGFNYSEYYCCWELRLYYIWNIYIHESAAWKIACSHILREYHIWYGHWTRLPSSLFMISGTFPLRLLRIASDPARSQKQWNQIFLRQPHQQQLCSCEPPGPPWAAGRLHGSHWGPPRRSALDLHVTLLVKCTRFGNRVPIDKSRAHTTEG